MHKYERSKADRPDGFVLNKLEEAPRIHGISLMTVESYDESAA